MHSAGQRKRWKGEQRSSDSCSRHSHMIFGCQTFLFLDSKLRLMKQYEQRLCSIDFDLYSVLFIRVIAILTFVNNGVSRCIHRIPRCSPIWPLVRPRPA